MKSYLLILSILLLVGCRNRVHSPYEVPTPRIDWPRNDLVLDTNHNGALLMGNAFYPAKKHGFTVKFWCYKGTPYEIGGVCRKVTLSNMNRNIDSITIEIKDK